MLCRFIQKPNKRHVFKKSLFFSMEPRPIVFSLGERVVHCGHFVDKGREVFRCGQPNFFKKLKGVLNPNFRPFSFELKKKIDFLK